MVEDLVQWLGMQLDGDVARATEAAEELGSEWYYDDGFVLARREDDMVVTGSQDFLEAERGRFVAEHDPARVLREIDAKRQLIARGGPFCTSDCDEPGNEPMNPDTNWTTPLEHHFDCGAYEVAKVLAAVYADRPGYREEWRP